MYVVRPFTQEVEHLRKGKGHNEVVGAVRIADNEKGRRPAIPQLVKLHFIV